MSESEATKVGEAQSGKIQSLVLPHLELPQLVQMSREAFATYRQELQPYIFRSAQVDIDDTGSIKRWSDSLTDAQVRRALPQAWTESLDEAFYELLCLTACQAGSLLRAVKRDQYRGLAAYLTLIDHFAESVHAATMRAITEFQALSYNVASGAPGWHAVTERAKAIMDSVAHVPFTFHDMHLFTIRRLAPVSVPSVAAILMAAMQEKPFVPATVLAARIDAALLEGQTF